MKSIREFLLLIRASQTTAAVRWNAYEVERARIGYAKAVRAMEQAHAELRIFDTAGTASYSPPSFLLKG